jgi:hypothetical protein
MHTDDLEPFRRAADEARKRYVEALERLRVLTGQTGQIESGTIAGGGIFPGVITMPDEALHAEEHQRRIASARQELDMSRMEYDDAMLRLQAERDERAQVKAERAEIVGTRIQIALWVVTAIIAFGTIAQVWVVAHEKPQQIIVPAPIVSGAAPTLLPAPVVNITVSVPTAQPLAQPTKQASPR